MQKLGRAITIMAHQFAREQAMHMDVSAFHAPSECHGLVSRGEAQREREARRHARAVSGLSRSQFNHAVKRLPRRAWERAVGTALERYVP